MATWNGKRSRRWCPPTEPTIPRGKGGRFQKATSDDPIPSAPSEAPVPPITSADPAQIATSRSAMDRVKKENVALKRQFDQVLKDSKEREAL